MNLKLLWLYLTLGVLKLLVGQDEVVRCSCGCETVGGRYKQYDKFGKHHFYVRMCTEEKCGKVFVVEDRGRVIIKRWGRTG